MVMVMVIVGAHCGGGKGGMEMTTVWRTMRDHVDVTNYINMVISSTGV
jgi:hypothetical protein